MHVRFGENADTVADVVKATEYINKGWAAFVSGLLFEGFKRHESKKDKIELRNDILKPLAILDGRKPSVPRSFLNQILLKQVDKALRMQ